MIGNTVDRMHRTGADIAKNLDSIRHDLDSIRYNTGADIAKKLDLILSELERPRREQAAAERHSRILEDAFRELRGEGEQVSKIDEGD
jgi:hypothetical protein